MTVARILAAVSGLLLLVTAYDHLTGTASIRQAIEGASLPPFLAQAIPVQWQFFSWHLAVLALPLLWAAWRTPTWFLPAAVFCAAVTAGDFVWVYRVAGWFSGTVTLLTVVTCLSAVVIVLSKEARTAEATNR